MIVGIYVAVPLEIEHYFVAYFEHVTALKRRTSVKDGARTFCVNVVSVPHCTCVCMGRHM